MGCNCGKAGARTQPTLLGTATPTTDSGPVRLVQPDGTTTEYATEADALRARARYGGRIYPVDTTTGG